MDSTTQILMQSTWDNLLRPDIVFPVLIFAIPIVAIVAYYWHASIKTRAEIELKREMVEAGMSADDIIRVLAAGTDETCRRRRSRREAPGDTLQTSPPHRPH